MFINHMKDIANLFGLKLEERFGICENEDYNTDRYVDYVLYFSNSELVVSDCCGKAFSGTDEEHDRLAENLLLKLSTGFVHVKKLAWQPKCGEVYYVPVIDSGVAEANELTWTADVFDFNRYKMGIVCKSKSKAEELSRELLDVAKQLKK